MTGTITALAQPANLPPRIQLTVAGSAGVTITITRTDPDGGIRFVRAAEPATLTGGGWVGFDYESPFDPTGTRTLTYTVYPSDGSAAFTATVGALQITQPWLIHPGVPDLSIPVTVLYDDPPETMDSGATLHQVIGRATPVPVTDGIRKSRVSQLLIATDTTTAATAVTAILKDTAPLLLQITLSLGEAVDLYPDLTLFPSSGLFPGSAVSELVSTYDWIQVGIVARDRGTGVYADPWRRWTLPFQVVDRPAGGIASQRTWADALAESASWTVVMSTYTTWQGLLVGTPGT